jgi:hypothetical protein
MVSETKETKKRCECAERESFRKPAPVAHRSIVDLYLDTLTPGVLGICACICASSFGLLETGVSLGALAAAPQVMSYLSRTLYNAQGGTSDGRHLAKLHCRRYLEALALAQGATATVQGECNEGWPAEEENCLQTADFALPDQDAFEAALV